MNVSDGGVSVVPYLTLPGAVIKRWQSPRNRGSAINNPPGLIQVFVPLLTDRGRPLEVERIAVAVVDSRRRVIEAAVLSSGGTRFAVVDSVMILRWALTRSAPPSGLFLAHNHPSGDPAASPADGAVTRKLVGGCNAVGLRMLDHVIIGDGTYYSFSEAGELPCFETEIP